MASKFLAKYGNLLAGVASIAGALLAFAFCIELKGFNITVKQGSTSLVWLIFSVSHAVYHFARPKGTGYRGGAYVHPIFNAVLDFAFIFPYLGLLLSLLGGSALIENPTWKSMSELSLNFLNSTVVFFLAASLFAGINSIEDHFSSPPAAAKRHGS